MARNRTTCAEDCNMPLFTNSPLERMMQQRPTGRKRPEGPALPPGHPCRSCGYSHGLPCVGVCYKELLGELTPAREGSGADK